MRELIDTNSQFNSDIPDGIYTFTIHSVTKKEGKGFYIWNLDFDESNGDQIMFANMMGPLLKMLGCEESSPGKYMVDTDLLVGKKFKAKVTHEPDKKDPAKIRQQMGGFEAVVDQDDIPF